MDDRRFSIAVDIFLRTGIIAVGWNINKYPEIGMIITRSFSDTADV